MRLFKKTAVDFEKDIEANTSSKSLPKVSSKVLGSVKEYLNPSNFSRDFFLKQLPFIIFLALLAILYIGNQYHAERLVNDVENLKKLRSEKRSEYISSASDLMRITRQSQVLKLVEKEELGLKPLVSPPKKVIVRKQ